MNYTKALTKAITKMFDGLSKSQLDELIQYYFDNYGGEGGCEECYEYWALCDECHSCLVSKAQKMTDVLQ